MILTLFDERVEVRELLQDGDVGHGTGVRHRLVKLKLELPDDVRATAHLPAEVRQRDRCSICAGDPKKKKGQYWRYRAYKSIIHVSHVLRDDVVVGHRGRRRVLELEETLEERNLLLIASLAGVHLRAHFVYTSADELEATSVLTGEPLRTIRTSAMILSESQSLRQRRLGIRHTRFHAQVGTALR